MGEENVKVAITGGRPSGMLFARIVGWWNVW